MNLAFAANALQNVKTAAAPALFWVKKHAPEILVATGTTSIVGGVVLSCKATLEARDILDSPLPEEGLDFEVAVENGKGFENDKAVIDAAQEEAMRKETVKQALRVVKAYLPGAGLIGGGIAMLVAAKSIEHRRFTAMLGAYSTLQSMFDEYRERIVAEKGEGLDYKAMNGAETVKIEKLVDQGDGKKPKKVKEEVTVFTGGENPYHRIFDDANSNEWRRDREANLNFLQSQEKVLNMLLQRHGRIFLWQVYEALGFEYNPVGQFVGWLADDIEGSKDGFISFGVNWAYERIEIDRAYEEGRDPEPSLWLTFNVDGEVWDADLNAKKYDI